MAPLYILFAIPFFLLMIGIEWIAGKISGRNPYRMNDTLSNLNIGIGQQAVNLFAKLFLGGVYFYFFRNFAVTNIGFSAWGFIACILLFDFLFYWAHRWSHTVNLFWGAHVVHHSSEEFNLSVALRQSWFQNILSFFIFIPVPLLGFEPLLFFAAAATHTLYQFWIHTEAIGKMPAWFELIFNTPSHHRVHHGRNPRYIDKNHAGLLIIWDRLFGTFEPEGVKPTYGITTPLKSWNPVWANFHYYAELFAASKRMRRWTDKIKLIFARPGWLPAELGGYQAPPEVEDRAISKYDQGSSRWMSFYVLLQFVLILLGLSLFMYHFSTMTLFYKCSFFILLILSTLICGAALENRRWVIYAEYLRLICLMVCLDTFYYFWHLNWFNIVAIATAACFLIFSILFTLSWRRSPGLQTDQA